MNIVDRPLKEIQFQITEDNNKELSELESWLQDKSMFTSDSEYIILLPHPKHPSYGGQSFSEFTENCPILLKDILQEIYDQYCVQMKDEKWTCSFDLTNDFGFILIAFLE